MAKVKYLLLALLLLGCAQPGGVVPAPENRVYVEIENDYIGPTLKIYLVKAGSRSGRLASVDNMFQRTWFLVTTPLSETQFYIISADRWEEPYLSETLFFVQPGDCIRLIIRPKISHSFLLPCGG